MLLHYNINRFSYVCLVAILCDMTIHILNKVHGIFGGSKHLFSLKFKVLHDKAKHKIFTTPSWTANGFLGTNTYRQ
jgi:hypothetical protein